MRDAPPQTILLKDYAPPPFLVSTVALDVDIRDALATVRATLRITRNPAHPGAGELALDGEDLELVSVAIDGRTLGPGEYRLDGARLAIPAVGDAFTLETVVRFDPWKNTKLEGLYPTAAGLVTQCEAEGFRRITYFLDRPDVMARYAVTLCGEKSRFPRLLANGNLVAQGEGEPAGWFMAAAPRAAGPAVHWARWEDPYPKPSYLFAMVAADLDLLEDRFTTRSGKNAMDGVRFNARSEFGMSNIEREYEYARANMLMTDEKGKRLCLAAGSTPGGTQCSITVDLDAEARRVNEGGGDFSLAPVNFERDRGIGAAPSLAELRGLFQANRWATEYNPVAAIITPGRFITSSLDASGRVGGTSFFASVEDSRNEGAVPSPDAPVE